ncbi:hypothetical protein DTW90_33430 [Neorhizobium sp. P12A]|uniref:hypothetical protein n=1 Tax=Neorhizobium sp. P12A TaxID=2268027 RepID=UPI0011F09477|nr:hypothetical protein [Neorhizobium sp. P12A]KAA0687367.1 hypothetical protein DTW90_33430 [Neorhizobium sp. P12A]
MDATLYAMLFGTLTLTCWMGAGLVALIGTNQEIRLGEMRRGAEVITGGLAGAGVISAIAMAISMVFR